MIDELNPPSRRLTSLDVVRGITMAGMILVNNAAADSRWVYGPLKHADWNGWTPTDLVFPSFLFIVGTSMALSFGKRLARGDSRGLLLFHALRRGIVIFVIGLLYNGFSKAHIFEPWLSEWHFLILYVLIIIGLAMIWPDEGLVSRFGWGHVGWRAVVALAFVAGAVYVLIRYYPQFQDANKRVPGVLQRIAICYFIGAVIVLYSGVRGRVFWILACLVGYWAIVHYVDARAGYTGQVAHPPEGRLHDWIDQIVFGTHVYRERPDPEGLLSTIPAIATTLLGVLAGHWLMTGRHEEKKAAGLLFWGLVLFVAGMVWDHWFPINKKLWTSSYVLLAGGVSMYLLGLCYLVVDVSGWRRWAGPFLVLGTNAIAVYVAAGITSSTLLNWQPTGSSQTLREWILEHLFRLCDQVHIFGPSAHSLAYSLLYVAFWMILFWPLYRARVFIRV